MFLSFDFSKITKRLEKYYLRDPNYYKHMNLYLLKNKAIKITRSDGESYVQLENKQKIPFDALVYAPGTKMDRENSKLLYLKNMFFADSIKDRPKLKKRLRDSKKICINSLNLESLEIALKIKKEFPEKNVMIMDHHQENALEKSFGGLISNDLIKYFRSEGIHFRLGKKLKEIKDRGDNGMLLNFQDGKKLKVDMIIDNTRNVLVQNKLLKSELHFNIYYKYINFNF